MCESSDLLPKGVAVQVFADRPLSKVALRTRLELKLRQSGIKMLAGDDRRSGLGKPVLELDAYVRCGRSQICACHVNLRLWQDAQLSRDSRITTRAITWQNSYTRTVGFTGTAIRSGATTDSIDLLIDIDTLTLEFIQDYLTVNPK
jgi:hypothetical protein